MVYLEKEDIKQILQHLTCNTILKLPIVTPRFRARIWSAVRLPVGKARIESFVHLEGEGLTVLDGARICRGTRIRANASVVVGENALISRNCFVDTLYPTPVSSTFPRLNIFGPIVIAENSVVPASSQLRPKPRGNSETAPASRGDL